MSGTAMAPPRPRPRGWRADRAGRRTAPREEQRRAGQPPAVPEPPTRRRCAAHPRSPPTTSPGSRTKTNVPTQSTPDSAPATSAMNPRRAQARPARRSHRPGPAENHPGARGRLDLEGWSPRAESPAGRAAPRPCRARASTSGRTGTPSPAGRGDGRRHRADGGEKKEPAHRNDPCEDPRHGPAIATEHESSGERGRDHHERAASSPVVMSSLKIFGSSSADANSTGASASQRAVRVRPGRPCAAQPRSAPTASPGEQDQGDGHPAERRLRPHELGHPGAQARRPDQTAQGTDRHDRGPCRRPRPRRPVLVGSVVETVILSPIRGRAPSRNGRDHTPWAHPWNHVRRRPQAAVADSGPPYSGGMEAAPPADDVTARREVLDRAREHYRMGDIGLAWRACAELAEMGRRAGDVAALADAATVIRRPIDPATRGRVPRSQPKP